MHWIEPRIDRVWGGFSQAEVTLALLRAALAAPTPGYLVFGSGKDYPIATNATIDAYLEANADVIHLDSAPIDQTWPDQCRTKVEHYTLPFSSSQGDLRPIPPLRTMTVRCNVGWGRRLVRTFGVRAGLHHWWRMQKPRTLPFGLPYGGSSWWRTPWDLGGAMVAWIDGQAGYEEQFRYCQCPDEMFFHTAVAVWRPTVGRSGAVRA
ncbi:MAG: beta-1,6-N-acetylglucosaminyltransferase [Propioniciclava sp.]